MITAAISGAGGTLSFEPLVQFGHHSAVPHHRPADTRLAPGDLVLLDFGAAVDGYCADTTRMAVAGEPTREQEEVHRVVLDAHDAAIAAVRAGAAAGDRDAPAPEVIQPAGPGDHFNPRTGHRVRPGAPGDPNPGPGLP